MHGSFNRADTMNFMAAIGPDFKAGFVNDAPVSNADIGKTMAHVLGLKIPFKGTLMGRVVEEALPGGASPAVENFVERAQAGRRTGSPPSWSASASAASAISTPPVSPAAPSAWTSARRRAADAKAASGILFHRRPHGGKAFVLRRAVAPHNCPTLCYGPIPLARWTPILSARNDH